MTYLKETPLVQTKESKYWENQYVIWSVMNSLFNDTIEILKDKEEEE